MSVADIWRDVGGRVGFFTKETRSSIPEVAGCYAWFLPLWIYTEDLPELVRIVHKLQLYDPTTNDVGWRDANLDFVWDSIAVRTSRRPYPRRISSRTLSDWQRVLASPELRTAFEHALMEATILMPPLYVGKASSLSARYEQHVKGVGLEANVFHSRFSEFARRLHLPLAVSDLLFVCIITDSFTDRVLRDQELNDLLEAVMKLLCRPAFGMR